MQLQQLNIQQKARQRSTAILLYAVVGLVICILLFCYTVVESVSVVTLNTLPYCYINRASQSVSVQSNSCYSSLFCLVNTHWL